MKTIEFKSGMFKEQLLETINDIIRDLYDILEILQNINIEKGNIEDINSNKKGVIIKTRYDNIYNLHNEKEFYRLMNFGKYIQNNKDRMKDIDNIYFNSFIEDLFKIIIDKVNYTMFNSGLLPIFSALCGDELEKNKYTIELYY